MLGISRARRSWTILTPSYCYPGIAGCEGGHSCNEPYLALYISIPAPQNAFLTPGDRLPHHPPRLAGSEPSQRVTAIWGHLHPRHPCAAPASQPHGAMPGGSSCPLLQELRGRGASQMGLWGLRSGRSGAGTAEERGAGSERVNS